MKFVTRLFWLGFLSGILVSAAALAVVAALTPISGPHLFVLTMLILAASALAGETATLLGRRWILAPLAAIEAGPDRDGLIRLPDGAVPDFATLVTQLNTPAVEAPAAEPTAPWREARLVEMGMAAAKVQHDLRNSLTAALLVAERLQESEDRIVSRSGLRLVTAIEQGTALLQESLDFAVEQPPVLTPSRFPLGALLDEAAATIRETHPATAIEPQGPVETEIDGDRAQLHRALANLLRMAARAQAKRIEIVAETEAGVLRLSISDNGTGFSPEMLARDPLRPFSGCYRYGSTGIGLVIARDLIGAHGGEISLAGDMPEGMTRLVIRLPLSPR